MTIVELSQASEQLPDLIRRVEAGEEIVLARDGRPVAQITPRHEAPAEPKRREGGQLRGQIWISPDFDNRLSDEPRTLGLLRGLMQVSPDFDDPLPEEIARAFGMID